MDLVLGALPATADDLDVEIAEHKGRGHPDTLCDALAEQLGRDLCRLYLDRFGRILHHNVDKALLRGGASRPAFGGGEVLAPIEIYVAGRAAMPAGEALPIDAIFAEGARAWLRDNLRALDPDRHVKLRSLVRPGSVDLVHVYDRPGDRRANDTSFGAGYAPFSKLERAVLAAARELAALAKDPLFPEVGEDIKVMGVRRGARASLTIACAFVDRYLPSLAAYVERRARVADRVRAAASAASGLEIDAVVNAADDDAAGSVYLTVTGTSAEAGDDGQVGRGNRVNGLITPYRPMTLEAAAGKNPVTHVGKLYNVVAHRIAAAIVAELSDVGEAHCHLASRIGHPVREPAMVHVRLHTRPGVDPGELAPAIERLAARELEGLDALVTRFVSGEIAIF
jgi:S-adenosylmethionine synthetase